MLNSKSSSCLFNLLQTSCVFCLSSDFVEGSMRVTPSHCFQQMLYSGLRWVLIRGTVRYETRPAFHKESGLAHFRIPELPQIVQGSFTWQEYTAVIMNLSKLPEDINPNFSLFACFFKREFLFYCIIFLLNLNNYIMECTAIKKNFIKALLGANPTFVYLFIFRFQLIIWSCRSNKWPL